MFSFWGLERWKTIQIRFFFLIKFSCRIPKHEELVRHGLEVQLQPGETANMRGDVNFTLNCVQAKQMVRVLLTMLLPMLYEKQRFFSSILIKNENQKFLINFSERNFGSIRIFDFEKFYHFQLNS